MDTEILSHLSEKPWSDYTKADYSIEQWHSACLIHEHEGVPTSKNQCKLPVKTPNGALNRNGVHAAAAALAGARGGVHSSSEQKSSAAKALIRYYSQMDEKPPPSLLSHSMLEHHGILGMKWGVRKAKTGGTPKKGFEPGKRSYDTRQLNNRELKKVVDRMTLEARYAELNKKGSQPEQAKQKGKGIVSQFGDQVKKKLMAELAGMLVLAILGKSFSKKKGGGVSKPKKGRSDNDVINEAMNFVKKSSSRPSPPKNPFSHLPPPPAKSYFTGPVRVRTGPIPSNALELPYRRIR